MICQSSTYILYLPKYCYIFYFVSSNLFLIIGFRLGTFLIITKIKINLIEISFFTREFLIS